MPRQPQSFTHLGYTATLTAQSAAPHCSWHSTIRPRTFRSLFFIVFKIIAVDELVIIIKIVVFVIKQLVVLFVRRLPFK